MSILKKVKNPVITANEFQVAIKGTPVSLRMTLVALFQGLRKNDVIDEKELHEIIDMSFMDDDELEKLANKKFEKLLKKIKENEKDE